MPNIRIIHDNQETEIEVESGANLRRSLLENGFTPYTAITKVANCGGHGICATCGVWIDSNEPAPQHWHDRLANRFGYPRLSCQITVNDDMTVRVLDDKFIWGDRDPKRANKLEP